MRKPRFRRISGHLRCSKCRESKPDDAFRRRTNGRFHSWCVDCKRAYDLAKVSAARRALKEAA